MGAPCTGASTQPANNTRQSATGRVGAGHLQHLMPLEYPRTRRTVKGGRAPTPSRTSGREAHILHFEQKEMLSMSACAR